MVPQPRHDDLATRRGAKLSLDVADNVMRDIFSHFTPAAVRTCTLDPFGTSERSHAFFLNPEFS